MSIQIAALSIFLALSAVLLVYTVAELLKEVLKDEGNIRECSEGNNTRTSNLRRVIIRNGKASRKSKVTKQYGR